MNRNNPYYSVRTGKNPLAVGLGLHSVLNVFQNIYIDLENSGFFQEASGYSCVDQGDIHGTLGSDIDGALLLGIRKENLWPISSKVLEYSEDDFFDVIEFLHEHVSQGIVGTYHHFGDCGWHYEEFSKEDGQVEFRNRVNKVLEAYGDGFELTTEGEIFTLPEKGFEAIHKATLPSHDPDNIDARVQWAEKKFRRHRASLDERRDAIRDLADVLEFLRPKLNDVLSSKDERELFNIANNFGIRHHNLKQKTNYDKSIWYSWMYYHYLTTIHAAVRLINK